MPLFPAAEFIPDNAVDEKLDAEIRGLLSTCFTGEDDWVFTQRRWFKEPPRYRWIIRDQHGALAAHIAMHDKPIGTALGERRIAGLAEVAVRPDCRKRGYVGLMVAGMHAFARTTGADFAMLFGKAEIYASSGYFPVSNPLRHWDPKAEVWKTRPFDSAMAAELSGEAWPKGEIDLHGPTF